MSFTLNNNVLQCRAGGVIRTPAHPRQFGAAVNQGLALPAPAADPHPYPVAPYRCRVSSLRVPVFPGCQSQGYCGRALRYGVPVFPGCHWPVFPGCHSYTFHDSCAVYFWEPTRQAPGGCCSPASHRFKAFGFRWLLYEVFGSASLFLSLPPPPPAGLQGGGFSSGRATRQF